MSRKWNAWKGRLLSFPERVALIQSVENPSILFPLSRSPKAPLVWARGLRVFESGSLGIRLQAPSFSSIGN